MDDDEDLDELLDEVEKKFCQNVSVASSARARDTSETGRARRLRAVKPTMTPTMTPSRTPTMTPSMTPSRTPGAASSSITQDADDLLEELVEEGGSLRSEREKRPKEQKPPSQSGGRRCCPVSRCCPVFVGGSSAPHGVGTASSKRSCDQLRCVTCDFRVLMFDDTEWDSSCDYLFLRNNVPDRQKLQVKLKKRRGFRAYACQCSWFSSSSEPTDLGLQPQLRWVCGKHRD